MIYSCYENETRGAQTGNGGSRMNRQIKNAKVIQSKSRKNIVHPLGNNLYQVVSASSGNVYDVTLGAGAGRCNCDWGKYRPAHDQRSGCSHVLAALSFVAQEDGKVSVSAWGNVADAARQHRQMVSIGDGVVVTVRA